MTDRKRDESFDLAINPDSMELRLWKNVQGDTRFARYVPWDELGAALQTIAEQKARIEELERTAAAYKRTICEQNDKILQLSDARSVALLVPRDGY